MVNAREQYAHLLYPQHVHTLLTNLYELGLNFLSKLKENNDRKTPSLHTFVCLTMPDEVFYCVFVKKLHLSEKGAVSHNVLY